MLRSGRWIRSSIASATKRGITSTATLEPDAMCVVAVDCEFLKCGGATFARALSCVPFVMTHFPSSSSAARQHVETFPVVHSVSLCEKCVSRWADILPSGYCLEEEETDLMSKMDKRTDARKSIGGAPTSSGGYSWRIIDPYSIPSVAKYERLLDCWVDEAVAAAGEWTRRQDDEEGDVLSFSDQLLSRDLTTSIESRAGDRDHGRETALRDDVQYDDDSAYDDDSIRSLHDVVSRVLVEPYGPFGTMHRRRKGKVAFTEFAQAFLASTTQTEDRGSRGEMIKQFLREAQEITAHRVAQVNQSLASTRELNLHIPHRYNEEHDELYWKVQCRHTVVGDSWSAFCDQLLCVIQNSQQQQQLYNNNNNNNCNIAKAAMPVIFVGYGAMDHKVLQRTLQPYIQRQQGKEEEEEEEEEVDSSTQAAKVPRVWDVTAHPNFHARFPNVLGHCDNANWVWNNRSSSLRVPKLTQLVSYLANVEGNRHAMALHRLSENNDHSNTSSSSSTSGGSFANHNPTWDALALAIVAKEVIEFGDW